MKPFPFPVYSLPRAGEAQKLLELIQNAR